MPEIIRLHDDLCDGIYTRVIDGLTIFIDNDVADVEDAMITFLRTLAATYPCAAQFGLLPLAGKDPHKMFAPLREGEDYWLTHINGDAHGCIWVEPEHPAGCFFPRLTESFFTLCDDAGELIIHLLLRYDQPLVYMNIDDAALVKINALYGDPPIPAKLDEEGLTREERESASVQRCQAFQHRWWEEMTRIIPLGIRGGYDDADFTAYSRDPASFALLDEPLTRTCQAIRSTAWFQAHRHELRWPDEAIDDYSIQGGSLWLPDVIKEERTMEAQRLENLRKNGK